MRHINKIWLIVSFLFIGSYCIAQTVPPSRVSQQVTALQYYFNTPDPGVGQAGNGAIIPITPTNDFTQQLTIPFSNLPLGINNLYVRVMDESGSWSIAERRMFLVDNLTTGSNIVAAEYYFDSDVNGVGTGTPIAISGTDVTQTLSIPLPNLSLGIHNLYIRTQNAAGVWSIAERRLFLIDNFSLSNIVAGEYFFDTDNGVGTGTPLALSGSDVTQNFALSLPTLSNGIHDLYIRTQSANGVWSIAERRVFLIDNALSSPIVAMEYFFDTDNGVGTGTPIPVSTSSDINGTFAIVIPCGMVAGNHQLFVRAQNENGIWSIFERGSFTSLSGIATPVVTANGPTTFCTGGSVVLSTTPAGAGISYQWFKDNNAITGQTSNSFTATESGSYTIQASCGNDVSTSTAVTVVASVGGSFVPTITSSNSTVCEGSTVTLTAITNPVDPNMNYLWNTGETSQSITVSTGGTYLVRISNISCSLTREINLNTSHLRGLNVTTPSNSLCAGNDVLLSPSFDVTGGDFFNYSVSSIPYIPENLIGSTQLISNRSMNNAFTLSGDIDDGISTVPLPFTFRFFGHDFNSINISTNGNVQFGNSRSSFFVAPDILNPSLFNFIACAWTDINFRQGGTLSFGTTGNAPFRKFYVDWNSFVFSRTDIIHSQIVINETTGIIECYFDFYNSPINYSIGMVDVTGNENIAAPGRNRTNTQINTPEGWRFDPHLFQNLFDTYSWSGPNSFSSSNTNPIINNAQIVNSGSYTVTATDNLGCTISAATNISVSESFVPTINASSNFVCPGSNVMLSADANPFDQAMTFLWNTGETSQTISVTTGGRYSVTINNGSCSVSESINLISGVLSGLSATATPNLLCAGQDLNLSSLPVFANSSNSTLTFFWSGPNGFSSTDANPLISNLQVVNSGTYSVTVTDDAGCSLSATTSNVAVTSGQIQALNCSGDLIVSNDHGLCGAIVNFTPANTGQQLSTITYSGNHTPGSLFNQGTTSVTATASNGCASASCTFNITVNDNEPPIINCPSSITQCNPVVTFNPTANDNCGGNISMVCNPPSGNTFPVGTTTVLVTATDVAGNTSTCSFNVTIQPMSILPTSISSSQGTTVCGTTLLTEVGGSLAGGGNYEWKEGNSCGNGTTISTSSTCTTTSESGLHNYFVRIVGATCVNSSLCTSIPITSTIPQTYFQDADGDGFGNPNVQVQACSQPTGFVLNNTDCNDHDATINPNTVWFLDADNDGYFVGSGITQCISPGAGYRNSGIIGSGDCNDANPNIHPGAPETLNGIDDDCNGMIDDICSANQIIWQKSFGGSGTDIANSIKKTPDGGFIIAGSTTSNDGDVTGNHGGQDFWVVKIDKNGTIQWQKTYGGSANDVANCIQNTLDGGYIVIGTTSSTDGDVVGHHTIGTDADGLATEDAWVIKIDNSGNTQWKKAIGGSKRDRGTFISQRVDGSYLAAINTNSLDEDFTFGGPSGSQYHGYVVVLDNSGNYNFSTTLGMPNCGTLNPFSSVNSITSVTSGIFVSVGKTTNCTGVNPTHYGIDLFNANLTFSTSNDLNTDFSEYKSIVNSSNGYYIGGTKGTSFKNFEIAKVDFTLATVWSHNFGGSSDDVCNSVANCFDGGIIMAGLSQSNDGDVSGNHGGNDYWVVKVDANGNKQWTKTLGGSGNDIANSIVQANDASYVIAGSSNSIDGDITGNHGSQDFWVVKFTSPFQTTFYRDADGDGYGDPNNSIQACQQPVGYVGDNTDCDDTRPLVHPGYVNAGPDQTKCGVNTATLAGSNPFTGTGTWTGPGVFANSHLFNTTVSGLSIGQNVFRWTVVNGTCGGSDDVIITVNPNPTPTIVGNPTFCFNGSDLLTTQSYLSYAWSANALNSTSQNVTVNTAGTYIVTVTDNNHCSATATKTITRNAPISTTITSPGVFCQGTQSTLGVSSTFSQYHWSNSQNNPTIIISTNGTYSVTVTTTEGCTGTASRTVTFLATPIGTIVAGSILNYCNSDSVSLYVTQNFSSYIWNNGDHARFTYITVPGTYTVTYTSSNGCTASTSITKTRLCEEATNFLTTGITKTTAVANWTPPSCSSNGYWLTLNQLTPSWSQVLNVFIQPNTHFTFSSLIPGTQYEWLLGTVCHIDLETHTFGADNRHNFTTLNARETGENGLLQSNFNVFPNPANNNVNVTFSTDKSEPFTIRMMDVTGRVVLDFNSISVEGDNQYELDLSSIAKGIYIVSLSKADGVLQTKLVVQ